MTTVASPMKLATSHSSRWSRTRLKVRIGAPAAVSRVRSLRRRLFLRRLGDALLDRLQRVLADPVLVLLVERQPRLAPHRLLGGRPQVGLSLPSRLALGYAAVAVDM